NPNGTALHQRAGPAHSRASAATYRIITFPSITSWTTGGCTIERPTTARVATRTPIRIEPAGPVSATVDRRSRPIDAASATSLTSAHDAGPKPSDQIRANGGG